MEQTPEQRLKQLETELHDQKKQAAKQLKDAQDLNLLRTMLQVVEEDHGIPLPKKSFHRLAQMLEVHFQAGRRKKVAHPAQLHPLRGFAPKPTAPNQLYVSDNIYLPTRQGTVYLSLVTDAYSRKIVGAHVHSSLHTTGCLAALAQAVRR